MRLFLPLLIASFLSSLSASAELPSRPEMGVLDSAQLLSLPISKATERVLSEHQDLTQETVFFVSFAETPEQGLDSAARAFLEAWSPETPKPPNAVLIAVDGKRGQLSIQSGLGLDTTIGPGSERAREIRETIFKPEWKAEQKSRAVVLSLVEALRALESPLVVSGEAVDAYERAGFTGGWKPTERVAAVSFTWVWMLFGGAFFAFALYRTLSVEVHTTGAGWHRVPVSEVLTRRLRKSRSPPLVTGGGVSGHY